jgi:hypothetical protein
MRGNPKVFVFTKQTKNALRKWEKALRGLFGTRNNVDFSADAQEPVEILNPASPENGFFVLESAA